MPDQITRLSSVRLPGTSETRIMILSPERLVLRAVAVVSKKKLVVTFTISFVSKTLAIYNFVEL